MAARHRLLRIDKARLEQELVAALERARDEGSLSPLSGVIPEKALDADRYILTGKRYFLFGPEERKLSGAEKLLSAGLSALAEATLPTPELEGLEGALAESGSADAATEALRTLLTDGFGVPDWIRRDGAPTILTSKEAQALSHKLSAAEPSWGALHRGLAREIVSFAAATDDKHVLARVR